MKSFNEGFYTEDFDQEMLDFIEANYTVDCDIRGWSNLDLCLCYSGWDKDFYLAYSNTVLYKLTKEEFKRKIGMPTKGTIMENETVQEQDTFGKKDLVDGMFVKTREGEIHVVIGDSAHDNTGHLDLGKEFEEDLTDNLGNSDLDIVEVFIKEKNYSLIKHLNGEGLKSIWKRTPPKSEKVIKLEKLIVMHEEQLEATKKLLAEELTL